MNSSIRGEDAFSSPHPREGSGSGRQREFPTNSVRWNNGIRSNLEVDSPSNNIIPAAGEEEFLNAADIEIGKKVDEIIKRIKFKKYIKKFLSLSQKRMQRLMTPYQHKLIADMSAFYSGKIMPSKQSSKNTTNSTDHKNSAPSQFSNFIHKISSFSTRCLKFLSKLPVFLPNHPALNIWLALKILSLLICFFCYLICFAFGTSTSEIFDNLSLLACQFILGIDILVIFNTGIYTKGMLSTNRADIVQLYCGSRAFYIDFFQFFFGIIYFATYNEDISPSRKHSWLLLPILFKHRDINSVIKKVQDKFLLDKKMQNVVELVNLLKNILLLSHVFACFWVYIAKVSSSLSFQEYVSSSGNSSDGHTWITLMSLQTEGWLVQYIYSYYFITVTMITVGYGDIRPVNPIEVIVCIVLMMVCCVIFGFTINSIGEIFQDFFSEEKIIRQKRCVIGNYMKRKDISSKTKKSIYEYLEYYWKQQIDEGLEEEKKIVGQLSDNLKEQLLIESNKIILKQSKIFRENFSPDLIKKCLPIIQEMNCTPGEIIIDASIGNADCYIYFVQQGDIEATHHQVHAHSFGERPNQPVRKIKKGDSFGEWAFFTGETQSMTVKSVNFSILLRIKREDFLQYARPHASEYETFCMVKDRAIFSNDMVQLYVQCNSCGEFTHEDKDCPVEHFVARRAKIIGQGHIGEPMKERNPFQRRLKEKQCSLRIQEEVFEKFKSFIYGNLKEIDQYDSINSGFSSFNYGINLLEGFDDSSESNEDEYLDDEEEEEAWGIQEKQQEEEEDEGEDGTQENKKKKLERNEEEAEGVNMMSTGKANLLLLGSIGVNRLKDSTIQLEKVTNNDGSGTTQSQQDPLKARLLTNKQTKTQNIYSSQATESVEGIAFDKPAGMSLGNPMKTHGMTRKISELMNMKSRPLIDAKKDEEQQFSEDQEHHHNYYHGGADKVPRKKTNIFGKSPNRASPNKKSWSQEEAAVQFLQSMLPKKKGSIELALQIKQKLVAQKLMKKMKKRAGMLLPSTVWQRSMMVTRLMHPLKSTIHPSQNQLQGIDNQPSEAQQQFEIQEQSMIAWENSQKFDLLEGEFEAQFHFKNYFPKANCREIMMKINGAKNSKQSKQLGPSFKDKTFAFKEKKNKNKGNNGLSQMNSQREQSTTQANNAGKSKNSNPSGFNNSNSNGNSNNGNNRSSLIVGLTNMKSTDSIQQKNNNNNTGTHKASHFQQIETFTAAGSQFQQYQQQQQQQHEDLQPCQQSQDDNLFLLASLNQQKKQAKSKNEQNQQIQSSQQEQISKIETKLSSQSFLQNNNSLRRCLDDSNLIYDEERGHAERGDEEAEVDKRRPSINEELVEQRKQPSNSTIKHNEYFKPIEMSFNSKEFNTKH